ncbi:hypothetical protein [Methanosarcina soligelidi]|uniref:hypothetical protein n=1 Tax=Methanosarcina soligelidi TaxID=1036677 RepID=UPI0012682AAA|nr:hypothetical protein [Methanosarcina soligelidi]
MIIIARKTKLTDEIIDISVQNVRAGMSLTACSQAIGISYESWRTWMSLGYEGKEPYARFYIRIQEAEAALQRECLDAVRTSIRLGNVEDAKWLLERKYSSEFGKISSLKVDQKTETRSLNMNVNSTMTKDERRAVIVGFLDKLNRNSSLEGLNPGE